MRKLRQLSLAVVLTLALSACALAGTIDTPPAPSSVTATGTIDTPPSAAAPVADPVVDVAFNLLLSALVLF